MRYSDTVVTSDNIGEEASKLLNDTDNKTYDFCSFVNKLPIGYLKYTTKQGYDEWVYGNIVQQEMELGGNIITAKVAYEFANGFMIFNA